MRTAAPKLIFGCQLLFLILFIVQKSFGQCAPQTGPPPASSAFNSGIAGSNGTDHIWFIGKDSITADYVPATIMTGLPDLYHNKSKWISFSQTGEHTSDRYFFYKATFDLPCSTLCAKSYNDPKTFCLNIDLYADNSIYEIYVNGAPQSSFLGNMPLANPFNPIGHTQNDKTAVSLCSNWKAGNNTIIIQLASSATVAGLMVEAASVPPPPPDVDTVAASICEGESFSFGGSALTKPGYYFHAFSKPGGCDSNVVLRLDVKAMAKTVINKTICQGDSFEGYSSSGTYTNRFAGFNGCDSLRTIYLVVQEKPKPDFGSNTTLCDGDTLQLYPGAFNSYLWQDGSSGDHFLVSGPGLYSVTATNNCGSTTKEVQVTDGICHIYFPSGFTPNKDGLNDEFKVLTDYKFESFRLVVFNRWGEKVFESYDPLRAWDGTYGGKPINTGTYIWFCKFSHRGTISSLKGTITVIR
jgi:gliding motility-associated-like protein